MKRSSTAENSSGPSILIFFFRLSSEMRASASGFSAALNAAMPAVGRVQPTASRCPP